MLAGIDLGKLLLLGRDLDHEALAQIAGANAGGIEMLHQVDAAANEVQRPAVSGDARRRTWQTLRRRRQLRPRRQFRRRRQLCPRRQFRFEEHSSVSDAPLRYGRLVCFLCLLRQDLAEGGGQFLFAGGEVSVFVEVTDNELRGFGQFGLEGQSSQLPRQVIG